MPPENIKQFIPKQPIEIPQSRHMALFFPISLFAAGAVLFLWAGAFIYLQLQQRSLGSVGKNISQLEGEFDPKAIQEMQSISVSLESLKILLAGHLYSSALFDFLEQNTLTAVRFTRFSFSKENYALALSGEGTSFSAVAQQLEAFEEHNAVQSVNFQNLFLTNTGNVSFDATLKFNQSFFHK